MTLTTGFSALTELGELGRAATEVAIGTWSDPAVRASLAQQRRMRRCLQACIAIFPRITCRGSPTCRS